MPIQVNLSSIEREKSFFKSVCAALTKKEPVKLLCIGGTANLNEQLWWLYTAIFTGLYDFIGPLARRDLSNLKLEITSVEASINPLPTSVTSITVNHNPAINPNQELDTEKFKERIKHLGIKIDHFSLCSVDGVKISRSSCGAVSLDGSRQTPLYRLFEKRYGRNRLPKIMATTSVYSVPLAPPLAVRGKHLFQAALEGKAPACLPKTPHQAFSTFGHDLKALFISENHHQLTATGILTDVKRIGLATDSGRVYFRYDDTHSLSQLLQHISSHVTNLSRPLDWSIDHRKIINPAKIALFNDAFASWLTHHRPSVSTVIVSSTDPGPGYFEKFPFFFLAQDSDDALAIWELIESTETVDPHHASTTLASQQRATMAFTISDDCLNLRAVWLISQCMMHTKQDHFAINIDPTANRPLPGALSSDSMQRQINCCAQQFSKWAVSHCSGTVEKKVEECYRQLLTLLHETGLIIIRQFSKNNSSFALRTLVDQHQRALTILSACKPNQPQAAMKLLKAIHACVDILQNASHRYSTAASSSTVFQTERKGTASRSKDTPPSAKHITQTGI